MRKLILTVLLAFSAPACAEGPMMCPSEADRSALHDFRDQIANADSPEQARQMALSKTALGHKAINRAGTIFPHSKSVADAEQRLDAFEDGVDKARTQEEVASQFDTLMAPQVDAHCSYTTEEVAIIIIGFVLGIIPGIIFLFLFC